MADEGGKRTSNATIHVEKVTQEGDGDQAAAYNLASDGETLLLGGDIEAATSKLRKLLEEMD